LTNATKVGYNGYINKEVIKMELTEKQLKEDIETAIRIRDNCQTWAEKDALERLINFAEETMKLLKTR
jgi:hypothetical protein